MGNLDVGRFTSLSVIEPTMTDQPDFDALPLDKDGPPFNAWGLYGPDDELGRLNLITPESTLRGAKAVRRGVCINLKLVLSMI
jgi:hypothetical protein